MIAVMAIFSVLGLVVASVGWAAMGLGGWSAIGVYFVLSLGGPALVVAHLARSAPTDDYDRDGNRRVRP